MRELHPDDFNVGKLVTVTKGPYIPIPSPFPIDKYSGEKQPHYEETELHGRVFKILVFDQPWIILLPLDGKGEPPEMMHHGPFSMMSQGGWSPRAIKLNTRGVTLSEPSQDYIEAYIQHCCPPSQRHLLKDRTAKDKLRHKDDAISKLIAQASSSAREEEQPEATGEE